MNPQEESYWSNIRTSQNWDMFEPDFTSLYQVNFFDDGNDKYSDCVNIWAIYGIWQGKVALINENNPNITIPSISHWKVTPK